MAEDFDVPDAPGITPAVAPGGAPGTRPAAPTGAVGPNVSGIRTMQLAIQSLAKTISSTIDYNAIQKAIQAPPAMPVNNQLASTVQPDQSAFQAGYGKDMFSNFMIGHYLTQGDVKGVEYDTNPDTKKILDKKPSDLKSMFVIVDSLQRIGSEKSEQFADGKWGPRTNNALKNISAIATAVMKLGTELDMKSEAMDTKKIAELKGLIPNNDTDMDINQKIANAPKVTEIINGVRGLFLDFKQQVFMDPTYRNFITGKAPIMKFGPKKDRGANPSQAEQPILADLQQNGARSKFVNHPAAAFTITLPKEYVPTQFQSKPLAVPPITGADLVSTQAFDNWSMRQDNQMVASIRQQNPASWTPLVKIILNQVKEQIQNKMEIPATREG